MGNLLTKISILPYSNTGPSQWQNYGVVFSETSSPVPDSHVAPQKPQDPLLWHTPSPLSLGSGLDSELSNSSSKIYLTCAVSSLR